MKKTIIVLIALTIFGVSAMSRERKPLRRKENLLLAISYGFHVPPVDDILAEDFKTIKEYGYTHVDIDIFWSETEWREGILNLDGIQKMFDLANEAGLKVIANFIGTPERSAPHWAFRKFSDEGIVNGPSGQARGPEHAFGTF